MNDMINTALHEFSFHLAKTEIEIFKERKRWRSECALTNYFQSTPEKAVFSRVMYIAAMVKQGYTVGEMAKELSISRQTISNLCKETVSAGWVLCKKENKRQYYHASDELCASIVNYADYSSDMFQKTMVHESEVLLGLLKRRKAALPITNYEK